jgi:hypothetical protein
MNAWRRPQVPGDHAGGMPDGIPVRATTPQVHMPAEPVDRLAADAAEAGTERIMALPIGRRRNPEARHQPIRFCIARYAAAPSHAIRLCRQAAISIRPARRSSSRARERGCRPARDAPANKESIASRGIGGVKRRPIAWVSTGVGKTSGSALSSRANPFRLISSRHSDMLVRRFPACTISFFHDNSGDHAGSDAKLGVSIRNSLRPVRSMVKSAGPALLPGSRKNITTRPLGAKVGPSL